MKNDIFISKLRFWVEFVFDLFFNDIDIHQISLKPLKILEFLVENSFKKMVFYTYLVIDPKVDT